MSLSYSRLGARQKESGIARLMTTALERPELLSLAAGFTDNDTLPLSEITKLAVDIGNAGDRRVLQYGSNQGDPVLRAILTQRLQRQDKRDRYDPELSFISNGSQQALYLAVQTLCDAGDIILVEQPTYFVFLEMLRGLGVEAVSMPMGEDGEIDIDGVASLLDGYRKSGDIKRVKAVYLVTYFANPSGHSVSRARKEGIVKLLAEYDGRIALFEDAAYRELYYTEPFKAESCIASADTFGDVPVFYSTTLTKPFASGLKVGYGFCTDADWLSRMLAIKGQQDFGTANYNQALFVKAFQSGLFDRHLVGLRKSYLEKMNVLDEALGGLRELGWDWPIPEGGLYIWARAPECLSTGFDAAFHDYAIEEGVMYVPGELCFANREARCFTRLSFGVLRPDQLEEAGRRFVRAAARIAKAPQEIV